MYVLLLNRVLDRNIYGRLGGNSPAFVSLVRGIADIAAYRYPLRTLPCFQQRSLYATLRIYLQLRL